MPISLTSCPHCGRPQFFPNVDLAGTDEERGKLSTSYDEVISRCKGSKSQGTLSKFDKACESSAAVFACSLEKLHREVATGTDVFETFHDLERLRLQVGEIGDHDWAKLRPQAEIELLGGHQHLDKLHYASLSIGETGLTSYGKCLVKLSEPMIAHRASCFEGNTAVLYKRQRSFDSCLRSTWPERNRICTAVFGEKIDDDTEYNDFPTILVDVAENRVDDQFIEVHIFGPMTAKTFESVRIDGKNHSNREKVYLNVMVQKLVGVKIEVVNE